jgi:hypothetical protein
MPVHLHGRARVCEGVSVCLYEKSVHAKVCKPVHFALVPLPEGKKNDQRREMQRVHPSPVTLVQGMFYFFYIFF